MRRYTDIVILCEDRQQEVFARHFLVNCGINRQRIRARIAPRGAMSGEQYVRQTYPLEVKAHRSRCHSLHIALVVLIDADQHTVTERLIQLDQQLTANAQIPRQPDDKIGIFVPRRNIETWIHYLQGESVNETDAYPKLSKESDCKPLIADLASRRGSPLAENAPPSLHSACDELARIL